ncbi:hypothetical protein [Sphingomonas humi]|uniref:DUF2946 domain-containing protein n=1 Tax=Sphingomonas humi TaxID=335630 RepID=A0ABP7SF54_9SPHN
MRMLLAFLAFIALALGPVGMPAEARTSGDHCAEMAGMDHGQRQPQQDHGGAAAVKSCCTAMAAALPVVDVMAEAPSLRVPLVAPALPAQHGVRREVEVPPPRV